MARLSAAGTTLCCKMPPRRAHFNVPFIVFNRHKLFVKVISILLTGLFFVNDISWALDSCGKVLHPSLRGREAAEATSKLSTPLSLTAPEFKERYALVQFRLSAEGVRHDTDEQIRLEREIFKTEWENHRTERVDVNDTKYAGRIYAYTNGPGQVVFVKRAGLLASTDQLTFVDLIGELDVSKEFGGIPVIVIDSMYCNTPDKCVQKHEIDELLQWENFRTNILHIATVEDMGNWIRAHFDKSDPGLNGTDYKGMTSRQIAQLFCDYSYPVRDLYDQIFREMYPDDPNIRSRFELQHMNKLLQMYPISKSKSLNVTAKDAPQESADAAGAPAAPRSFTRCLARLFGKGKKRTLKMFKLIIKAGRATDFIDGIKGRNDFLKICKDHPDAITEDVLSAILKAVMGMGFMEKGRRLLLEMLKASALANGAAVTEKILAGLMNIIEDRAPHTKNGWEDALGMASENDRISNALEAFSLLLPHRRSFITEDILIRLISLFKSKNGNHDTAKEGLLSVFVLACRLNPDAITEKFLARNVDIIKILELDRDDSDWFDSRRACYALSNAASMVSIKVVNMYRRPEDAELLDMLQKADTMMLANKDELNLLSPGAQQLAKIQFLLYLTGDIKKSPKEIIEKISALEKPYVDFCKDHTEGQEIHISYSVKDSNALLIFGLLGYLDIVPGNVDECGVPKIKAAFESPSHSKTVLEFQTLPSHSYLVQNELFSSLDRLGVVLNLKFIPLDVISGQGLREDVSFVGYEKHTSISGEVTGDGNEYVQIGSLVLNAIMILRVLERYAGQYCAALVKSLTPEEEYIEVREPKESVLGGRRTEFLDTYYYVASDPALKSLLSNFNAADSRSKYLLSLALKKAMNSVTFPDTLIALSFKELGEKVREVFGRDLRSFDFETDFDNFEKLLSELISRPDITDELFRLYSRFLDFVESVIKDTAADGGRNPSHGWTEGLEQHVIKLKEDLAKKDYTTAFDTIMTALESVTEEDDIDTSQVNFDPFKNSLEDFVTAVYPNRAGPGFEEFSSLLSATDIFKLKKKLQLALPILQQKKQDIRAFLHAFSPVAENPAATDGIAPGPERGSKTVTAADEQFHATPDEAAQNQPPSDTPRFDKIRSIFGSSVVMHPLDLNYDFQQLIEDFRRQQFMRPDMNVLVGLDRDPSPIMCVISETCNGICDHCLFSCTLEGGREMSFTDLSRVVDFSGIKAANPSLHITGGEVTLRKDLFEIISEYDVNTMNTNTSLMTSRETARSYVEKVRIARGGKEFTFRISIDDSHLARKVISLNTIANFVEAVLRYYPEADLVFNVLAGISDEALRGFIKEMSNRGMDFKIVKSLGFMGSSTYLEYTDKEAKKRRYLLRNIPLGRIGRALDKYPDSAFESYDGEISFAPPSGCSVDYRGDMSLADVLMVEHSPLVFGNIIRESWKDIMMRLNKDPLFRALAENPSSVLKYADEYERGSLWRINEGRPGLINVFLYLDILQS